MSLSIKGNKKLYFSEIHLKEILNVCLELEFQNFLFKVARVNT